jgi:hypothetical protein
MASVPEMQWDPALLLPASLSFNNTTPSVFTDYLILRRHTNMSDADVPTFMIVDMGRDGSSDSSENQRTPKKPDTYYIAEMFQAHHQPTLEWHLEYADVIEKQLMEMAAAWNIDCPWERRVMIAYGLSLKASYQCFHDDIGGWSPMELHLSLLDLVDDGGITWYRVFFRYIPSVGRSYLESQPREEDTMELFTDAGDWSNEPDWFDTPEGAVRYFIHEAAKHARGYVDPISDEELDEDDDDDDADEDMGDGHSGNVVEDRKAM